VYLGLQAVAALRRGKTDARETEPVAPAPEGLIEPVRARVSAQVRAMIDLQLLTGARPGELCILRTGDIDRGGAVWIYRPGSHKNAHRGHPREIYLGPKAQALLTPLLKLDPMAFVFSPADAERERAARRRAARKTKVQPSQAKRAERARRRRRRRPPTDRYTVASYRQAIAGGCARAFPPPEPLARRKGETAAAWRARLTPEQAIELRKWIQDHRWHPHQLRHNAATRLRKQYGLEAAQVILGHRTLSVTEIYAEKNVAKAREIMGAAG
jgi:integrase